MAEQHFELQPEVVGKVQSSLHNLQKGFRKPTVKVKVIAKTESKIAVSLFSAVSKKQHQPGAGV